MSWVGLDEGSDDDTQEFCKPSQEQAEVVACGGEDSVDAVAEASLKIVPFHTVLGLDVADDRLDCGAPFHLAADWGSDAARLAGNPDSELLLVIVATITLVDMDAAGFDPGQRFQFGYDRSWPSNGLPWSALAWSTNWPPLGFVTGVAIDTLQPNS